VLETYLQNISQNTHTKTPLDIHKVADTFQGKCLLVICCEIKYKVVLVITSVCEINDPRCVAIERMEKNNTVTFLSHLMTVYILL